MPRIYRSVDIVVQNHTWELLTVESANCAQGEWSQPAPLIGEVVRPQGAGRWQCVSYKEGVAAEGFMRLGTTKGYVNLYWSLPNDVSGAAYQVDAPSPISGQFRLSGENLDQQIFLVTLVT